MIVECNVCHGDVDVQEVTCAACTSKNPARVAIGNIGQVEQTTVVFDRDVARGVVEDIRSSKVISCGMSDRCANQLEAAIAIIDCIPHDILVAMLQPRVP